MTTIRWMALTGWVGWGGGTPDLRRDRRDQARRTTGKSGVEVLTRRLPSVTAERLMGSEGGENTSGKVRKKTSTHPLDTCQFRSEEKKKNLNRITEIPSVQQRCGLESAGVTALQLPPAQAACPKMHPGWALLQLRG